MVRLDRSWSETQFNNFALPIKTQFNVPIFMNQWEAVHGISAAAGRYDYIEDVASLAEEMGFGWAWWTWAGGNSDGFKGGQ